MLLIEVGSMLCYVACLACFSSPCDIFKLEMGGGGGMPPRPGTLGLSPRSASVKLTI